MTHTQHGQEVPVASHMDGITVKISEHYKPPPRINLPISYAQRLSLNKQYEDNAPTYNFQLETRVKEHLEELRRIKKASAENRKLRSERLKEELTARAVQEKEVAEEEISSQESSPSGSGILQPVLKPIPLNTSGSQVVANAEDRSPFNISDFEADTSSPFDNMELKTLNDMEELAQVLRSETTMPTYPAASLPTHYYNSFLNTERSAAATTNSFLPNYAQPNTFNGTTDYYSSASAYSNIYKPNLSQSTQKTVPDVLKALETKLSLSNGQSSGGVKRGADDPDDPFPTLPKRLQDLIGAISTMGFPRGRVARACQLYGDDQKKVVEHLLALTELMDLGFSEKNVASALQQCNNDKDKALDKLIL